MLNKENSVNKISIKCWTLPVEANTKLFGTAKQNSCWSCLDADFQDIGNFLSMKQVGNTFSFFLPWDKPCSKSISKRTNVLLARDQISDKQVNEYPISKLTII